MSIIVVFYSRYSQQSLDFLQEIEKIMEVRKLCIDNQDVRGVVISEKENYKIEYVPSILIFHSNGFMERHSGIESCKEWLEKVKPQEVKPIILSKEKNMEEVKLISTPEKIPIEEIEYEPRRMDTKPLIEKRESKDDENENIEEKLKEERETQAQTNMKKNNPNDNILSLAQQMQKQRESEVSE
jgi:hypothetical protein